MAENMRTDARRVGRSPVSLQTEILLETGGRRGRQMVTVIDMSLLGLRIRLIGALFPGQLVTLIPSERSPNIYPCRVKWASALGAEFYTEAGLEIEAAATKSLED